MRILICIDDTDNLESIGTGEVLENLCTALYENRLGRGGFVTRHQLFVHEDIPYTSHNSAMCCQAEIDDLDTVIAFCREYLNTSCAEGSDPGLCIIDLDKLKDKKRLIQFGISAKSNVLCKQEAVDIAGWYPEAVYLTEHGGTGDGIIGALAGCGLRLSGSDGKVKGKLKPSIDRDVMTVGELCSQCLVSYAMNSEKEPIDASDTVWFAYPTKAVFWDNKLAVYLAENKSGKAKWRVYGIQELKGLVD